MSALWLVHCVQKLVLPQVVRVSGVALLILLLPLPGNSTYTTLLSLTNIHHHLISMVSENQGLQQIVEKYVTYFDVERSGSWAII